MKFANHVSLVRETRVRRYLRPTNRAISKANERSLQALDAKHPFRGEADMLPQPRVQRPNGHAGLRCHILDASISTQRKLRDAMTVSEFAGHEIRNQTHSFVRRVQRGQPLQQFSATRTEDILDRHRTIREVECWEAREQGQCSGAQSDCARENSIGHGDVRKARARTNQSASRLGTRILVRGDENQVRVCVGDDPPGSSNWT